MRSEGYGFSFRCVLTDNRLHFVGKAFVDNADIGISHPDLQKPFMIADTMQNALTTWQEGLTATGGALAPKKPFWYLVHCEWKAGHWSYASINSCPSQINVKDWNGNLQVLERLDIDVARRSLGVYIALNGQWNTQVSMLREKSVEWAGRMKASTLSPYLAMLAYSTRIHKKLSYLLAVTCLTEAQCKIIQSPALGLALTKAKIGRDFPNACVFGQEHHHGLGILSLYATQILIHLQAMTFADEKGEHITSGLMQASLEALKLELG
jgi:hypothetical protein